MSRPVIIGAGHNGLTAAFYLAKAGLKPLVLERGAQVGGGAITAEIHPGFHCPVLSHELLLHADVARDMGLRVSWLTPDARLCALAPDAPPLVLHEDVERTVESLRQVSPGDADGYERFDAAVGQIASVLAPVLTAPPPSIDSPGAGDLWNLLKPARRFRALDRRDAYRLLRWLPMPVADLLHECFASERLSAALAGPGVSGTMLGPWSAGSALVMLMREAHRRLAGAASLRVHGGPGALSGAMAAAAATAGAEIRTGTPVEHIVVRGERVTGVVAGGREIAADVVLSAVDPKTTLMRLVDPADLPPDVTTQVASYRAAGTMAKINLALSSLPAFGAPEPALSGRLHFGPDIDYMERAFDHAKYGEMSAEPWLDVMIPSITDPDLAPRGAHVASIYVHYAPVNLRAEPWSAAAGKLLDAALTVLETCAPDVRAHIVAAQVVTPEQLETECGLSGGHVFHGELAPDQLFTMRPLLGFARYESPIAGLYLCSAGTHPGGFLTGASGRLAAQAVISR